MSELRLESTDGEYLLLTDAEGVTHRLLIDEALRKAIRREAFSADESEKLSPREIQLEVRAGVSIEELAEKTGASLAYVEKFAAPVIDELSHIVKSALSVRITMAGDRYNETTQVEFGDVITNRLANIGVVNYRWTARKSDNGGWQVQCHFEDTTASWAFDPRKLSLSPENEAAIGLSTQQSVTDGPIPRLRSVVDVTEATTSIQIVQPSVDEEPEFEDEPEVDEPEAPRLAPVTNITADLGATQLIEPASEPKPVVPASVAETAEEQQESLSNTADLLDALRRRRLEREREVLETATGAINVIEVEAASAPESPVLSVSSFQAEVSQSLGEFSPFDTAAIDVVEENLDGIDEPSPSTMPVDLVYEVEPEAEEAPAPKRTGRPSMPSWDEIVFNNRSDD